MEAVAYNGMTGDRLHNLYPLLYNDWSPRSPGRPRVTA